MGAQEGADLADDAGAILVLEQQENAGGLGLDVAVVDFDDAGSRPKNVPATETLSLAATGGDFEQLGEIAGRCCRGFR